VKVAVIDGFINPDLPVFQGANLQVDKTPLCKGGTVTTHAPNPSDGEIHGSDVTALLVGNGKGPGQVKGIAPKADVTFYGYGVDLSSLEAMDCRGEDPSREIGPVAEGIRRAVEAGAQVVSISITEAGGLPATDAGVIADALAKGVVIVAAVPNSTFDDLQKWPQDFNGVVAVNAFGQDGKLQSDLKLTGERDVYPGTTVVAPGVAFNTVSWGKADYQLQGSSLATPLTAGVVALAAQKYPHASGNQLIQSLIRNTTPKDHPLKRTDEFGYGPVSLRHVLREDPAQYKDENPLMDKSSGMPTRAQVAAAKPRTASPSPSASGVAAQASGAVSVMGPLIVTGIVLVVVIVVGVIVLLVVLVARRKKNAGGAV
jgi:subtilisin family serine protease